MSELLTIVQRNNLVGEFGRAHWGRLTREEAIRLTREAAQCDLEAALRFLETPDDELEVRVVRGPHRQALVEILGPKSAAGAKGGQS